MKTNMIRMAAGLLPLVPAGTIFGANLNVSKAPKTEKKPNVLIIYCDQLAAWTLGCYGGNEIGTPNIDRLAKEGVVATNFYANTPVSTPSRGCFMSGLYPTEHGAYKNDLQIRQDIPTFASELRDNGYVTGYAGKWHLDGNPKRPGWDIRGADMGWTDRGAMYSFGHYKTIEDKGGQYPVFSPAISADPEHYPTDWFADRAMEFMDKHKDENFCFMLSIPDPHGPYTVRAPYDKMYPPRTMKMPRTLMEEPESDHFLYMETRMDSGKKDKKGKKEIDQIRKNLPQDKSQYFGAIKCIDDNVGRVIRFLKEKGLYDNTIIVFSADHGDMMGNLGRMAKAVPFESAARVPFIVRYPSKIKAGTTTARVSSAIDFYPTIFALAGLTRKGSVSGSDITPCLTGKNAGRGQMAYLRSYSANFPWVGVVTERYKLIFGEKDKPGQALLLDREKDPEEARNFYNDPAYASVVKDLTAAVAGYCRSHNDPHWSWMKDRVGK